MRYLMRVALCRKGGGARCVLMSSELEERLRSGEGGGSSRLPSGAKYSLWRAASDLPLHRVSDRLSVAHLQPRSSRDRYRLVAVDIFS